MRLGTLTRSPPHYMFYTAAFHRDPRDLKKRGGSGY